MGSPEREGTDDDARTPVAEGATGGQGPRIRIKPPTGTETRAKKPAPGADESPQPGDRPAPEVRHVAPLAPLGEELDGLPDIEADLGLGWLGAQPTKRPSPRSWMNAQPRVVKPLQRPGPNAQPDLTGPQQLQGAHPGDRYVRIVRQQGDDAERIAPGHPTATEEAPDARSGLGRVFGKVKRAVIGDRRPAQKRDDHPRAPDQE